MAADAPATARRVTCGTSRTLKSSSTTRARTARRGRDRARSGRVGRAGGSSSAPATTSRPDSANPSSAGPCSTTSVPFSRIFRTRRAHGGDGSTSRQTTSWRCSCSRRPSRPRVDARRDRRKQNSHPPGNDRLALALLPSTCYRSNRVCIAKPECKELDDQSSPCLEPGGDVDVSDFERAQAESGAWASSGSGDRVLDHARRSTTTRLARPRLLQDVALSVRASRRSQLTAGQPSLPATTGPSSWTRDCEQIGPSPTD